MCVFRENTEDIYAGIEWEAGTPEAEKFYRFLRDDMGVTKVRFPETSSFGVKPVSREGTERLVRAACQYALEHHLPSVTLVHKGNIMKFTEGGFKKWGYELAEREFGKELAEGRLVIKDCIADAFLQNTLLIPEEYSVIATLNLNGDYAVSYTHLVQDAPVTHFGSGFQLAIIKPLGRKFHDFLVHAVLYFQQRDNGRFVGHHFLHQCSFQTSTGGFVAFYGGRKLAVVTRCV